MTANAFFARCATILFISAYGFSAAAAAESAYQPVKLGEATAISLKASATAVTPRIVSVRCEGRSHCTGEMSEAGDVLRISVFEPADRMEITLRVRGADRLIRSVGSGCDVLDRAALQDGALVSSGLSALQNGSDQSGLVVRCAAPTPGEPVGCLVEADGDDVEVRIVYEGSAAPKSWLVVRVTAYRGDSLIALEDARRAEDAMIAEAAAGDMNDAPEPFERWIEQGDRLESYDLAETTGWLFFPDQDRIIRPLLADQREAQIRVGFGSALGEKRTYKDLFDISLGGDLVLLRKKFSHDRMMTASVRGLMASRFEMFGNEPGEGNFPLLCTDYFGGVALAYVDGPNAFEFYGYHESSHLGDETILTGAKSWANYSREAVRLLWSRDFGSLRLYGGGTVNVSGDVDSSVENSFAFQCGGEYRFQLAGQPFYAATDVQGWEYNGWRPNVNTQVGWFWHSDGVNPLETRVFLEYYNGRSNMGQYWDVKEQSLMLGAGMIF